MPYYYVTKQPPKKKRRKRAVKITAIVLTVILLLTGLFIFFNNEATDVIRQLTESTLSNALTTKINEAFDELMNSYDNTYTSYVETRYDSQGNITLISADMIRINKLMAQYSTLVQEHVSEIESDDISVPVLAFTGWPLIATLGKPVSLNVVAVGNAPCSYRSEFVSEGINQTRHSIYIDVKASVEIILPVNNIVITSTSSALICENVIVGKVPEFYLKG